MRSVLSRNREIGLCLLFIVAMVSTARAHTTGETYVWLNVNEENLSGRVEINLNDLRNKLDLNVPLEDSGDEKTRLEFIKKTRGQVLDYVRKRFDITVDGKKLDVDFYGESILDLPEEEGSYAQYYYGTPTGTVPDLVTIHNSLFVDDDFMHRSLVCIKRNAKSGQVFEGEFTALVFGSHNPVQELDLTHIELLLRPRDFVWQGVWHIWIGIDHILFIVVLLLPAVLIAKPASAEASDDSQATDSSESDSESAQVANSENGWLPVPDFKTAFWNIIRIVTIFTIAHSITLSLAAIGVFRLQSRIVESVIALSIIFVAWNTVAQKFQDKTWLVIFGFGLFHGMGFASVMSELPFRMVHLVKVLIGFNVGVELGQLAIVAVAFPVLFLLRKNPLYVPVVLKGGSVLIGLIACYWFAERAFGL